MFCIGATKAGTTWLHRHLSQHPECHLRSIKELHYFSKSEPQHFDKALREGAQAMELVQARMDASGQTNPSQAQQMADLCDWQDVLGKREINLPAYRQYMESGIESRHVVGDVTPGYALMPMPKLKALLAVGSDVRIVYLIRDPLERLWSHVRMIAKRTALQSFANEAAHLLDRVTSGDLSGEAKGIVARGNYAAILPKLARVFDPRRLLVLFYEDLMTSQGVAKLSAFLGIACEGADFARRVHVGLPLDMSAAARHQALAFLRPQYDYVAAAFQNIPAVWRANMNEGLA